MINDVGVSVVTCSTCVELGMFGSDKVSDQTDITERVSKLQQIHPKRLVGIPLDFVIP